MNPNFEYFLQTRLTNIPRNPRSDQHGKIYFIFLFAINKGFGGVLFQTFNSGSQLRGWTR